MQTKLYAMEINVNYTHTSNVLINDIQTYQSMYKTYKSFV